MELFLCVPKNSDFWSMLLVHKSSPASLGKQLQTRGFFPDSSLLFHPGLVVAFGTKGVAESSEKE